MMLQKQWFAFSFLSGRTQIQNYRKWRMPPGGLVRRKGNLGARKPEVQKALASRNCEKDN